MFNALLSHLLTQEKIDHFITEDGELHIMVETEQEAETVNYLKLLVMEQIDINVSLVDEKDKVK